MSDRRITLLPKYCWARIGDKADSTKSGITWNIITSRKTLQLLKDQDLGQIMLVVQKIKQSVFDPRSSKPPRMQNPDNKTAVAGIQLTIREATKKAHKLRASGRYLDAEAAFKDALRLTESIYPKEHPRITEAIGNYAAILRLLGRTEEAKSIKFKAQMKQEGAVYASTLDQLSYLISMVLWLESYLARHAVDSRWSPRCEIWSSYKPRSAGI
jgi:hypothetical protein